MELNRLSLGRTSLTANGDLNVVTAINQSLSVRTSETISPSYLVL